MTVLSGTSSDDDDSGSGSGGGEGPPPCALDANGCATTGYTGYGNNERCTIQVNYDGTLTATSFDTEYGYDEIGIGGVSYSGGVGPQLVVPVACVSLS